MESLVRVAEQVKLLCQLLCPAYDLKKVSPCKM